MRVFWVCVGVWEAEFVCVSVLWLTQTSLYVTVLGVHQRGCQGTSSLFDSIHDTWAAIYNECHRATYLISSAPSLQIHAPQITCVRNGTFARMTFGESVFPWDVRRIMKSVIPISGLAVPLCAIVDLSSAFRGLWGRMQACRELCCSLHCVQLNSELFLKELPLQWSEARRHLGTYWPLNCLRSSITL